MIAFLISLLIVAIILGVAWYIIGLIPLPSPLDAIVRAIFLLIAAIVLIYLLLGLIGAAPIALR